MARTDVSRDTEYHALAPAAVASLVLGLLSPLALVGSLLWIVPAVGFALGALALRAIRNSGGDLTGTRVAYAGLALSTLFAVAAPAQTYTTRVTLSQAARPIADAWFEFLREREPQKALQLHEQQLQRRALNDHLWDYYRGSKETYEDLQKFVAAPVPRLILEYGKEAQVRFYETHRVATSSESDLIELVYAVTFPAREKESAGSGGQSPSPVTGGGKQTFFVLVVVERRELKSGEVAWRIANQMGGFRPASLVE